MWEVQRSSRRGVPLKASLSSRISGSTGEVPAPEPISGCVAMCVQTCFAVTVLMCVIYSFNTWNQDSYCFG